MRYVPGFFCTSECSFSFVPQPFLHRHSIFSSHFLLRGTQQVRGYTNARVWVSPDARGLFICVERPFALPLFYCAGSFSEGQKPSQAGIHARVTAVRLPCYPAWDTWPVQQTTYVADQG